MADAEGKLWGGRFQGKVAPELWRLSNSTHFDWRLAELDLRASLAHLDALAAAKLVTDAERKQLEDGIRRLLARLAAGELHPAETDEDVHGALERALVELLGPEVAGKLRAGRSRNDQIATLIRLYLLTESAQIAADLQRFANALVALAEKHPDLILVGRTHLQPAQPVRFAHHLLAHAWPLVRNLQRLRDWAHRAQSSPYGAGAIAGNSLGLDPKRVAKQLGLSAPTPNSIDATASRDLVAEFCWVAAMIGIDSSRLAEELVLWATPEFGYIRLPDSLATGSSLMPQKKNPDIPELARGKSGRLVGNLTGLLTTLKALPLGYNRDLQEDKEPAFDSVDTLQVVLPAMAALIEQLEINEARMRESAEAGFSLATDIADALVRARVPFREAHELVGKLVLTCEQKGSQPRDLTDNQLKAISPHLTAQLIQEITAKSAVEARDQQGGTSKEQVEQQIRQLKTELSELNKFFAELGARIGNR